MLLKEDVQIETEGSHEEVGGQFGQGLVLHPSVRLARIRRAAPSARGPVPFLKEPFLPNEGCIIPNLFTSLGREHMVIRTPFLY